MRTRASCYMAVAFALAAVSMSQDEVQAFVVVPPSSSQLASSSTCSSSWSSGHGHGRRETATMMAKSSGPPNKKKRRKPKPSKVKQPVQRQDAASKAYDEMAAAGIPEYNIFIKPKGTDDYLPAGVMTVPRSQQVSQAVFEQEDNLKQAAFKFYSKLKEFEEFEYGYTLKMFPDDPITPIEVRPPSGNAVSRFFEGLLNPVNTQGMKGPEIKN